MGRMTVTIRDYSDELTTFGFNYDDLSLTDVFSLAINPAEALETALAGAIRGTIIKMTFSQDVVENENERPASPEAQREEGLRITFVDDETGDRYGVTLGTAHKGNLAQPGTDLVPLDHAEVSPIVSWMETNALSKAGNAITVESAKLVGRNN